MSWCIYECECECEYECEYEYEYEYECECEYEYEYAKHMLQKKTFYTIYIQVFMSANKSVKR